jgi:hypothetical protein
VLRLDTPVNLVGPYPRASIAVGGAPPELAARAPLEAILVGVYRILPWGQVRLLPLVAAVALAAWGFSRLFAGRRLAAFGATLLFVTNPFMYERVVAGQEFLVLGCCLLPMLLSLLWERRSPRAIVAMAGVLVVMAASSLHLIFIAGRALRGIPGRGGDPASMARGRFPRPRDRPRVGGFALLDRPCGEIVGEGRRGADHGPVPVPFDLRRDARALAEPGGALRLLAVGWPLPKDGPGRLAAVPDRDPAVGAFGLAGALRDAEGRRRLLPLLVVGCIGLVLAAGDQGFFGGVYGWTFRHLPEFRIMREPQKVAGAPGARLRRGLRRGARRDRPIDRPRAGCERSRR